MERGYDLSQPEFEVAGPSSFATFARQLRESDNPALGSWPSDEKAEEYEVARTLTNMLKGRNPSILNKAIPDAPNALRMLFNELTVGRDYMENESNSPHRAYDAATTLIPDMLDFIPYMKPHRS